MQPELRRCNRRAATQTPRHLWREVKEVERENVRPNLAGLEASPAALVATAPSLIRGHRTRESTGVPACGFAQRGTPTKPAAHSVAWVTGYHWLLGLSGDWQHLLPGEKQAFPQHPPPFPPHGKPSPFPLMQQMSPASVSTQAPTQQVLPPAHLNLFPCLLMYWFIIEFSLRNCNIPQ